MSGADLEIMARLHARELVTHVPPDTQTVIEGSDMTPTPEGARVGLPGRIEPAGHYRNVVVEKRLAAATREPLDHASTYRLQ